MNPQRSVLLQARKVYSDCARKVEAKITHGGLSRNLSDQIIGIGVAFDWTRRAAEMEDIIYMGSGLNKSKRKLAFVEQLRFDFSWFGLNAIFSRPALLNLIGMPAGTAEYDAFRVLFDITQLQNMQAIESALLGVLRAPTSPRLPDISAGTVVTTINAIYTKYLEGRHVGKTAKAVAAAAAGSWSALDIPTLLYAFRNWSVHGNALEGSFGTRPGFLLYVETLEQVLAEVHLQTARTLLTKL